MTHEDAPDNTARAARLREFVAQLQNGRPASEIVLAYKTGDPQDRTPMVTAMDLLVAADALEALGVKGYAAARLSVKHNGYPSDLGDVALEAADTPDDTLRTMRQAFGDRVVDEMLDELAEQL